MRTWEQNRDEINGLWPHCTWSDQEIDLWRSDLSKLNQDVLLEAIREVRRTRESPYPQLAWIHASYRELKAERARQDERARDSHRRTVDGEQVYKCRECLDSGIIEVFNSKHVEDIRAGRFQGGTIHKAATHCNCETGHRRYAGLIAKGMLRPFNSQADVRIPRGRSVGSLDTREEDLALIDAVNVGGQSLEDWAGF